MHTGCDAGGGGRLGPGRDDAGGGGRLARGGGRGGAGGGDRGDVGGRGEGPACGPGLARGRGLTEDEEVGDVAQRRRCRRLPLPLGGAGLGARQGRRDRRAALGGPHRRGLHRVREMGERWIRRAGRGARKRGERAEAERNRSLQGKVVEEG